MTERLKHDGLAKKILSDPIAAQEFLSHYLPESCKSLLDLDTIKIEKESFVEEDLKQKFSDLVFSIRMKIYWTDLFGQFFLTFLFYFFPVC
ncbi:MAG: Rpn family recombination-promoting nuclease/putative transposase [Candidatus Cardinium sp.]|nr:Rpn family recombination-promoting nuclease/putative transposase [Candidatus Cardinium sp.]